MPDKIHLEIVSAEEQLFSSDVEMVFAPAEMGEVGISPKHTPLISRLKPGDVRAQINKDQIETFFVSGGILEIQPNEVTILSDTALREEDLDEDPNNKELLAKLKNLQMEVDIIQKKIEAESDGTTGIKPGYTDGERDTTKDTYYTKKG